MNTIRRLLSAIFQQPLNFANAEDGFNVPMDNGTFDFKKMVLALLGVGEGYANEDLAAAYTKAMAAPIGTEESKQHAAGVGLELAHKVNAKLTEDLTAANAKLAELDGKVNEPSEHKIKVGSDEVVIHANAAEAEVLSGKVNAANAALTAANEKVTAAEATAANARQSLRKFVCAALVKEGRSGKADAVALDAELSKPEFANAEAFDKKVAELFKQSSKFGTTSSIYEMLEKVGELAGNKNSSTQAANEMQKLVTARMSETGEDYAVAWGNVKKSEKGKGLLAAMKQPAKQ